MITEDYCSFEVAKLLKEKGFNEKCEYCYAYFDDNDIRVFELRPNKNAQYLAENRYPYVTHQMTLKWLREEKGVYIEIRRSVNTFLFGAIIRNDNEDNFYQMPRNLETYEQAVEAALKYSLENLIKENNPYEKEQKEK